MLSIAVPVCPERGDPYEAQAPSSLQQSRCCTLQSGPAASHASIRSWCKQHAPQVGKAIGPPVPKPRLAPMHPCDENSHTMSFIKGDIMHHAVPSDHVPCVTLMALDSVLEAFILLHQLSAGPSAGGIRLYLCRRRPQW